MPGTVSSEYRNLLQPALDTACLKRHERMIPLFILLLPFSSDPYQVMYLSVAPDGHSLLAKVELRYLPGPGRWFLSVSDAATGKLYVNQIPLVCSYTVPNDLFFPFRHFFQGSGIGSFFVVKAVGSPSTPNPSEKNPEEFHLLWTDQNPIKKGTD